MTSATPSIPPSTGRESVRLWLLGFVGLVAGGLGLAGWFWLDPLKLLDASGYWFIGLLFLAWTFAASRWLSSMGRDLWRLLGWWGLAGSVAVWALLSTREPGEFKVLMDEPLLMDTSLGMHGRRSVSMPAYVCEDSGIRGYWGTTLDKRPLFFPFVLSSVHDLAGYRVENVFWLNRSLLLLVIVLGWILGRRLDPDAGGPIMLLWCSGWPLLAQNASGGGFDLLNLALMLVALLATAAYFEERNHRNEVFLLATCLLMANTRYESILFVGLFAVVWLVGAIRARSSAVSWFAVVSPLFLVPYVWQRGFMAQHAWRWEAELRAMQSDRLFGTQFIADNLARAWHFLVVPDRELAGSAFLGSIGLVALMAVVGFLLMRGRKVCLALSPVRTALLVVLVFVGVNFGILMFYFWGRLDDPMASRLALPLIAGMGLSLCFLRPMVLPSKSALGCLMVLMGCWVVGYAVPSMNEHRYSRENMHMRIFRWAQDVVARQSCRRPLVISPQERVWTAYRTFALLPESANPILPQIEPQLREGVIDGVFVVQSYVGERNGAPLRLLGGNELPAGVVLEQVAERSFYPYHFVRISRVASIDLARAAELPATRTEAASGLFIRLTPEQLQDVRSLLP